MGTQGLTLRPCFLLLSDASPPSLPQPRTRWLLVTSPRARGLPLATPPKDDAVGGRGGEACGISGEGRHGPPGNTVVSRGHSGRRGVGARPVGCGRREGAQRTPLLSETQQTCSAAELRSQAALSNAIAPFLRVVRPVFWMSSWGVFCGTTPPPPAGRTRDVLSDATALRASHEAQPRLTLDTARRVRRGPWSCVSAGILRPPPPATSPRTPGQCAPAQSSPRPGGCCTRGRHGRRGPA